MEQLNLQTKAVPAVTLAEARDDLFRTVRTEIKGTECPCCGRLVKVYRRKLHTEMAAFLCRLVRHYQSERRYYSTREMCPALTKASTDGSYLTHWGLVRREPSRSENESGGRAGLYAPTEMGIEFVHRRCTVPARVHLLCGEVVGWGNEHISIEKALGDKFDYHQLMEE